MMPAKLIRQSNTWDFESLTAKLNCTNAPHGVVKQVRTFTTVQVLVQHVTSGVLLIETMMRQVGT